MVPGISPNCLELGYFPTAENFSIFVDNFGTTCFNIWSAKDHESMKKHFAGSCFLNPIGSLDFTLLVS